LDPVSLSVPTTASQAIDKEKHYQQYQEPSVYKDKVDESKQTNKQKTALSQSTFCKYRFYPSSTGKSKNG